MAVWVREALRGVEFGDARLERRLLETVEQLAQSPAASVPQACGDWPATKAAYRLWDNDRVTPAAIIAALAAATNARALREEAWLLAVQDTMAADWSSHPRTSGLGRLGADAGHGLWVHSTLLVNTAGTPLGLVGQEQWARDPEVAPLGRAGKAQRAAKSITEKESYRWLAAERDLLARLDDRLRVVTVADREADIFDLFVQPRRPGAELLIRANHTNRCVLDADGGRGSLAEWVAAAEPQVWFGQRVWRRGQWPEREAQLCGRCCPVTLAVPSDARQRATREGQTPVGLWAVWLTEEQPPAGVQPVSWWLLTTLTPARLGLSPAEFCRQMGAWYACRWVVERYHFVLKSGCGVEQLQLRTAERLGRALATYAAVAWGCLWLTLAARERPDESAQVALASEEWQALYAFQHGGEAPPGGPPTLREAVRMIARLGGFLARRGDGEPGPKTVWRGLCRLHDITAAWLLFNRARET